MKQKKKTLTTYVSFVLILGYLLVYIFYICLNSFCQELTLKYLWEVDMLDKLFVKFFLGGGLFDTWIMVTYCNK